MEIRERRGNGIVGMVVALACLVIGWVKSVDIDSNPMAKIFANPSIAYTGCKDLPDMFTKCKKVQKKDSVCSLENVVPTVYSTWEQNNNCKGIDYYSRAADALRKQSSYVWNVTNNWTTFFDNRAQSIQSAPNPMFVCSFGAKKWYQVKDLSFFRSTWQPNAIKCSNYVADARRAMMCSMCDPNDQSFYSSGSTVDPRDGTAKVNATTVNLSFQTCSSFMEACVGYLESKQKMIDMLNVEFTLGLCDKDGMYLAVNTNEYKKILPSDVIYDEEYLTNCKGYLNKDLTATPEQLGPLAASCVNLCERYYSWTAAMVYDDFLNLKYLKYMHDILKEIVDGKFLDSMFTGIISPDIPMVLDFSDVYFKFSAFNSSDGLNINKHIKDNDFKLFDSSQFIKGASIPGMCVELILGLVVGGLIIGMK